MAQASAISGSHFSSSHIFSIASATLRLLNGLSSALVHISIFSFSFICQYPLLLNSLPLSLKKRLEGLKYDIHIKNMLQITSAHFLVLISLVDVSIKCRIQYWLCPCSFNSRHTVSLNLFSKVNPTLGQGRGLLNLRQTEQKSQKSLIR